MNNKPTCEFHVDTYDPINTGGYPVCGRPAKYVTPMDHFHKKDKFVCGIHANSVNKMYVRLGIDKKCQPI